MKKHTEYTRIALLLLMLVYTALGWSWNGNGHRMVAQIASTRLTPQAKAQVDACLAPKTMMDVASWADQIRSTDKRFNQWHFTTLLSPKSTLDEHHKNGQLYHAILEAKKTLLDPKADPSIRCEQLKLLIHWVADAHQPLHVGNGRDKGGNHCWIRWFKRKRSYSLHRVWDDFLVKYTLNKTDLLAKSQALPQTTITTWQHSNPKQWLHESRALHAIIYPKPLDATTPYCKDKEHAWIPKHYQPTLSQDYSEAMRPIVEQRLLQAGIRLAGLLNQIFDHNHEKPTST